MKKAKIDVVVAAMHQKDFSLINKMNIKTNAVIANQCNCEKVEHSYSDDLSFLMVSTVTRGVGLNRNIGLAFSSGDILLFSDQDVTYYDDYESIILSAFSVFPRADVICFGNDFTKNGDVYSSRIPSKGKLPIFKSLKFGTYVIAIKRESLLKKHLNFTQLFGGGCIYSHGEDSDFILQCFKNKLHVYSYNEKICKTAKDVSTCFDGYNEKYFYDTGALGQHTFKGFFKKLYFIYIAFRIKDTELSFFTKFRLLREGAKGFEKLQSYDDWKRLK